MTSLVIAWVTALSGWPVYAVIGALVFAESALFVGFVLPGEAALLVGAALAGTGRVHLAVVIVTAAVAAVVGDSVGFAVGDRFGPRLLAGRLGRRVPRETWEKVVTLATRRGGWAVFAGRWTAVLRAMVPAAAGTVGMPYRTFLTFNVLGGVSWSVAVGLLGYSAGASLTRAVALMGHVSLAVGAVVAGAAIWLLVRWRRTRVAN
ncbi:DedA family protein [Spongisporangium articulatum]|uniref:DedA family protein n=1 Tax=Spongisporangium articulatum TaxID=3362603 RepID=A0ABW8AT62_9ACTN